MEYDLIIIGADVAGLSAGIYAGRKKLNALILTRKFGGQSIYIQNIENYPGIPEGSGIDLISKAKEQAEKFGVDIKEGEEVLSISKEGGFFTLKTKENEYKAKTVIVATGRHWKTLNVPGEKEFIGRGVGVCAICDAPFFADKDVVVVGGGNSAFDSAYDLLKYANKIYLLQHSAEFKGDRSMYDKLQASGKVEFITNGETMEIKGDKFVTSLVYEDKISGETKEIKTDGVFVNIGQIPNSSFVEEFLELNDFKEIKIDHKTNSTSVQGVFAAGDVSDTKYKQSIIAAAEGAKAALSACEWLK